MKRKSLNNKTVYTKVLPLRLLNESAKRAEEGQLVDTTYNASDVILLAGCCCMYADFPAAEKQTCCEVDYLQIGNLAEGLLGTIDYVASSLGILFFDDSLHKTSLSVASSLVTASMEEEALPDAPIEVRSYGQNDYHRYEAEALRGTHLCVGSKRVGEVSIDCKYHYERTQVGVLGQRKKPAGIIYMDITFHQTQGYWLESAMVYITIGEDDTSDTSYILARSKKAKKNRTRRQLEADVAVQMTQHYGPRYLTGNETSRTEAEESHFVPTLGIAANELGGVGFIRSSSQERKGCWTFKGSVVPPPGCSGLRTLLWEFRANRLEPDQDAPHDYCTAFAFEHSRKPLYMRVEIDGKLYNKAKSFRHSAAMFSSRLGGRDRSTVARLDMFGQRAPRKQLDEIADGLDKAMQMANLDRTPVKMPGSTMVTFSEGGLRQGTALRLANGLQGRHDPLIEALRTQAEDGTGIDDGLAQRLWLATNDPRLEPTPAQLPDAAVTARVPTDPPITATTEITQAITTTAAPTEHTEAAYKHPDSEVSQLLESEIVIIVLKLFIRINGAFGDASRALFLLITKVFVAFLMKIPGLWGIKTRVSGIQVTSKAGRNHRE